MIDWIKFQWAKMFYGWYSARIRYYRIKNEQLKKENEELIKKLYAGKELPDHPPSLRSTRYPDD